MSFINYLSREINCKIVYYGPGLCGKTTNLAWIHEKLPIKMLNDRILVRIGGPEGERRSSGGILIPLGILFVFVNLGSVCAHCLGAATWPGCTRAA